MSPLRRRRLAALAGLALGATALAACGSSGSSSASGGSGGSGLGKTVEIYSIQDASGAGGFAGTDDEHGAALAVADINRQHFLGSTQLKIVNADTGSVATQAASIATQAATKHYPVVIGPPLSGSAVAVAPILARANEPTVFTQAGSDGVLVGPSIFRLTPLQVQSYSTSLKWLQSKGVKTVATISDSDVPTLTQLSDLVKTEGPKYGLKMIGSTTTEATQSNIASQISKLLSFHAQALAVNFNLTQNATAATLIAQSGFKGPILAENGASNGILAGAGNAANGWTWTTDWVPGANSGSLSSQFAQEYQSAYHAEASDFSAESYDAVWFAARGLKAAGSTDTAKVTAALTKVGAGGFPAVLGGSGRVTVVNGQEQAAPVLTEWLNGKDTPLANQNP